MGVWRIDLLLDWFCVRVTWRCSSPGCVPRRCRLVWRGGARHLPGTPRAGRVLQPPHTPGLVAAPPGDHRGDADPHRLRDPRRAAATLAPPPKRYGVTHWSSRLLARHLGIGNATVARVWRSYGIQPWRSGTFKYSTDPELVAKVVVGAPLDPARLHGQHRGGAVQGLDLAPPPWRPPPAAPQPPASPATAVPSCSSSCARSRAPTPTTSCTW